MNEKGQRYLDQYDLEKRTHEKRPLQGGADALVIMSDAGLMAITSGGKMQVFNMAARQVVSTAQLPGVGATGEPNAVKYWRYTTAQQIAIYGTDAQIYVWNLATANAAPTALFKLQDGLLSGTVVDIQVSEDAEWFAVVVRPSTPEGKPSVQLYAKGRAVSSVLEAAAAAVYSHPVRGCTIMALAAKGPQGYRLMVAELASAPGPAKFERLVLEVPAESQGHLPVALLRQGNDFNTLSFITRSGHIHVANTETRQWIAHTQVGIDDFFVGAVSSGFAHYVIISSQGSVFVISPRTSTGALTPTTAASTSPSPSPAPSAPLSSSGSGTPPLVASTSASSLPTTAITPPPTTTTPPPVKTDSFSQLSLQSMVEPRKPQTPLEEFFSTYPSEALSLYKNDRAKFLPFFIERGITLNWQGLVEADKDLSVASKLAFGQAVAHLDAASRNSVYQYFDGKGFFEDNHARVNYLLGLLGTVNSAGDAEVQTTAIVLGLRVIPAQVVDSVVNKRWTHYDSFRVAEVAQEVQQWDLVWLLATSFEQRLHLLSAQSANINANQILPWFNSLPVDGSLSVLEALAAAQATSTLSWERIAAPPHDRLAPHIDLTVSPPFQTLRVKVAASGDVQLWQRYINLLVSFGESKELSRLLLVYGYDKDINALVETAIRQAAQAGAVMAAMPLLILAERSGKIEDLVQFYLSKSDGLGFLIPYSTAIQPQNVARIVAIAAKDHGAAAGAIILAAAKAGVLTPANLWLAANQVSVTEDIANILPGLVEANPEVSTLPSFAAKFKSS